MYLKQCTVFSLIGLLLVTEGSRFIVLALRIQKQIRVTHSKLLVALVPDRRFFRSVLAQFSF